MSTDTTAACEQQLQAQQVRYADYRTLVENFPTAFLVTQNKQYVLVNQLFASTLGWDKPEDLLGKFSEETIVHEFRRDFNRHLDEIILNKKPLQKAWWPHLTRSGDTIWLEGNPRRVTWQGKPAIMSTLVEVSENWRALRRSSSASEAPLNDIDRTVRDLYRLGKLVGKSRAMRAVYERVLQAAPKDATVLITGESGTGKEMVARTIHLFSLRSQGPFVAINCGAIPASLLESEFFGYRKGAFTGATCHKTGLLEAANNGTLFLDEVAELPPAMQVKLLRYLDDRSFIPVGGTEMRQSNARIIAATNRDLKACLRDGLMREDFYFRLYIIPIVLPALRERKEDISLLVDEFAAACHSGTDSTFIPGHVRDAMFRYDWPGNVRELRNSVQRYLTIGSLDIPESAASPAVPDLASEAMGTMNLRQWLDAQEQSYMQQALAEAHGNRAQAAALLGIPERTLYRKLALHVKNGS